MFDDFDHRRRIESAEPAVAIHQRAVHQANAFALLGRQPIDLRRDSARSSTRPDTSTPTISANW